MQSECSERGVILENLQKLSSVWDVSNILYLKQYTGTQTEDFAHKFILRCNGSFAVGIFDYIFDK